MGFIALLMLNTILIGSGAIGSTQFFVGLLIATIIFYIGLCCILK